MLKQMDRRLQLYFQTIYFIVCNVQQVSAYW